MGEGFTPLGLHKQKSCFSLTHAAFLLPHKTENIMICSRIDEALTMAESKKRKAKTKGRSGEGKR